MFGAQWKSKQLTKKLADKQPPPKEEQDDDVIVVEEPTSIFETFPLAKEWVSTTI